MLVDCPRCHFKQPQDQYCASCGVDMLAYKPKEKPFFSKVIQSGLFQFLIVVLLGCSVTYFVIKADRPQQWIQKINRFSSVTTTQKNANPVQPQLNSENNIENPGTEAGLTAEETIQDSGLPNADDFVAANAPSTKSNTAVTGVVSATANATVSATNLTKSSEVKSTIKAQLRMIEIDSEYLNTLLLQARSRNSVLVDQDIKVFTTLAKDINPIQVLEFKNLDLSVDNFDIKNYGSVNRMLTIATAYALNQNQQVILRVSVNKSHPNDTLLIEEDLILADDERFILAGHRFLSYFEFEADLLNFSPFQVFKSLDYRNQKTTFAIIVELL